MKNSDRIKIIASTLALTFALNLTGCSFFKNNKNNESVSINDYIALLDVNNNYHEYGSFDEGNGRYVFYYERTGKLTINVIHSSNSHKDNLFCSYALVSREIADNILDEFRKNNFKITSFDNIYYKEYIECYHRGLTSDLLESSSSISVLDDGSISYQLNCNKYDENHNIVSYESTNMINDEVTSSITGYYKDGILVNEYSFLDEFDIMHRHVYYSKDNCYFEEHYEDDKYVGKFIQERYDIDENEYKNIITYYNSNNNVTSCILEYIKDGNVLYSGPKDEFRDGMVLYK